MFQFLKQMISKKNRVKGTLTIQDQVHRDATVSLVKDKIVIEFKPVTSKEPETLTIPVVKISGLSKNNNTLGLIAENKKYTFEGSTVSELHAQLAPLVSDKPLFKAGAVTYYKFANSSKTFTPHPESVTVEIYSDEKYYLRISDSIRILHIEEITTDIQYYIDQQNLSFVWSVFSEGGFHTFCLRFSDQILFLEFRSKYLESSYRSNTIASATEVPSTITDLYQGIGDYTAATADPDSSDNEEWHEPEPEPEKVDTSSGSNRHLVMGSDQCYVTRGESLGIFDLSRGGLEFRTQVKKAVQDPIKLMAHDKNIIILEKEQRDGLNLMDLERGEVVERWEVDTEMNDCFDSVKTNSNGTLVGLSDYSLFTIDPRTKEKVVEKKEYKTKNEFSCGVAAKNGNVAVASRKGDLRLYDRIGKRAKSLLPGFGDGIIGIDTSANGKLVLCTCKSYILLFEVPENYSKHCKPVPRRLQLQPQHLSYLNEEVAFTPAKFDQQDTIIISSTGRFVVKWRVEDVISGKIYNYFLKALYGHIVDEDFVFNGRDIIVAMKNDVRKIEEADLKRPTRNY